MTDPSKNFPFDKRDDILPNLFATGPLQDRAINPFTGDVTTAVTYGALRTVAALVWDALGYLDQIEPQGFRGTRDHLLDISDAARIVQAQTADLGASIADLSASVAILRTNLDSLTNFLAVSIPAWINKTEVENGDDMGISRPSAASLELTVDFQFERQVAGFGHEDVISIDPLAGTLVKRGSRVTVTLNLEG